MLIDDFIAKYDELLQEAYNYNPDGNPIPCVGKHRNLSGLSVKNHRAHKMIHVVDTRLLKVIEDIDKKLNDIYDWKAYYERTK